MTVQMKNFLNELADLLEKHDVEVEVLTESDRWGNSYPVVDFTQTSVYDNVNDVSVRDYCSAEFDNTFLTREVLREKAKELV